MIRNMFHFISGTVKVKVSGTMPEKFINLCVIQNIPLWGLTKNSKGLFVCMSLEHFFSIRPLVRQSRNHIKVVGYSGLPFLTRKVKRRKMMVIGAAVSLLVLNTLVSYIWFIDITGAKSIPIQRIREIVYESGLKPGALKDTIPIKQIENQIAVTIPEVAWVGISFTGIHAVVEVVEKTMQKTQDKAPANIIAQKDGVITEIIPLTGQSIVKKGETVKKGDLLIKGISYEGPVDVPETAKVPPQLVRANGIIKARVWYESYGESELVTTIYERTGQQEIGVALRIGQQEFLLKTVEDKPEKLVEVEVFNKKLSWWRNHDLAVESIISTYHELKSKKVEIGIEEAKEQGKIKALTALQSLIPETAHVLSRNIEVLQMPEKNLVRVKVSVETVEDIGELVNITTKYDSNIQ
ncbi:sporulation protein YqfD [Pelosinus sp. UFO1]|uniref:sporulation protein YqfD n=1 Tax=Pelosinus sp. UFO1 TaxID=484770 RepID=UPI0004D1CE21|nr:sporulation protein YqfD [Pelosinus sp. UFO1]AIF52239.1 sporulation protein YqfD [Pelosinus sp. UFO1]